MARLPDLTTEQKQENKQFQDRFWTSFRENMPLVPNYKSKAATSKPALPMPTIGNQAQAQASQVAQGIPKMPRSVNQLAIKPYLEMPTINQAGQVSKVTPSTVDNNLQVPVLGQLTGVKGVYKYQNNKGVTVYSNMPETQQSLNKPRIDRGGTTPQERYAMQQAEFAGQDMQSQLAREEAAAAENKRQNLAMFAPQIGMNPMLQDQLQRSIEDYNRAMGSGNVADRSMAKHSQKMIDQILQTQGQVTDQQLKANDSTRAGNEFYTKLGEDKRQANQRYDLGMADISQKNPYYESLVTENNAQAQAATMPRLGQGNEGKEWEIKEVTAPDGSTQLVRANKLTGVSEPFKQAPMTPEQKAQQTALSNYKLAMDKLNVLDKDSPLYAQRLNALDNDPEVKQLRALGLI